MMDMTLPHSETLQLGERQAVGVSHGSIGDLAVVNIDTPAKGGLALASLGKSVVG